DDVQRVPAVQLQDGRRRDKLARDGVPFRLGTGGRLDPPPAAGGTDLATTADLDRCGNCLRPWNCREPPYASRRLDLSVVGADCKVSRSGQSDAFAQGRSHLPPAWLAHLGPGG